MYKLLFATRSPFYPEVSGGGEHSSVNLFSSLHQRGWQIEVICATNQGLYLRKLRWKRWQARLVWQNPPLFIKDEDLGYPCWRGITQIDKERQCLEHRLQEYQPDVLLSDNCGGTSIEDQIQLICHAADQGYPTFYFFRHIYGLETSTGYRIPDQIYPIANSPFTAAIVSQFSHHQVEVVLPFVDQSRYQVTKRERRYITFINPIPEKGVNVAIEIARRLPQERFLFVMGKWIGYSYSDKEPWMKEIYALPNVEVWKHQQDMRAVYAVTNILLVPSQFIETFGRVIIEAQVNGIPVVAAQIGGIPYTIGKGGLLVTPKDDPAAYIDALQQLSTNKHLYTELSLLAYQNSQRPEFDIQYQVNNFINLVKNRINKLSCS